MVRYHMTQTHFCLFPTDDPKTYVVWYHADRHNGHECFCGSFKDCTEYLKIYLRGPLPGDKVAVSDGPDATWFVVHSLFDRLQRLQVREAGTDNALQNIDRSMVKQHQRCGWR